MKIRHAKGSYNVIVEPGALPRLDEFWPLDNYSRVVVVTTEPLWNLYGPLPGDPLFIPDGESAKSLAVVEQLWRQMFACGLDRHTLVIALGGGTVGDIAGFTAATFMRGIDIVQVPTTLVAMLDAGIGGKTGINFGPVKNAVGSMHHPRLVLADPNCLATLPKHQLAAGMAEAIKSGVIGDAELFAHLESEPYASLQEVIERSAAVKVAVVNDGVRDHLNYGHTFAHALEALSGYEMVHGEAVALGMQCAARLSALLGLAGAELEQRQARACKAAGLEPKIPRFTAEQIVQAMGQDKKRCGERLRLVLAEDIGRVRIVEGLSEELITAAIEGSREKV